MEKIWHVNQYNFLKMRLLLIIYLILLYLTLSQEHHYPLIVVWDYYPCLKLNVIYSVLCFLPSQSWREKCREIFWLPNSPPNHASAKSFPLSPEPLTLSALRGIAKLKGILLTREESHLSFAGEGWTKKYPPTFSG